jgi:hypothetical protein
MLPAPDEYLVFDETDEDTWLWPGHETLPGFSNAIAYMTANPFADEPLDLPASAVYVTAWDPFDETERRYTLIPADERGTWIEELARGGVDWRRALSVYERLVECRPPGD